MFFRKRMKASENASATRLFGARVEEAPASVIGRNTRFRGEVRGSGHLVIRGQVEGSLHLQGRVSVETGSSLRADVEAPEMVLAGDAEGQIRVHELLSVLSTGILQGDVESGLIRVEEGGVLRGTLRRMVAVPPTLPDQSTP
jgi:cytoskeletal protein CcmA (bactofilin family)